ncbi:MAG: phenylalanine--tRNA ligase subunit beta [Candidatus Micrarchaeota archaeon]
MAVVEFDCSELCAFAGKKVSRDELGSALSMLGTPVEETKGDAFFVEVTPNRVDLLSVEGMGRALSSFLGVRAGLREYSARPSGIELFVDKSVQEVRPFIVGAVVRDLKIDDKTVKSLMQVQEKIHDTFGRKRKKIAIGVHNLDVLAPPFYYKAVKPHEVRFVPLDMRKEMDLGEVLRGHPKGVDYAHILKGHPRYPVIIDSKNNVLSFPPIINGELTRVTERTRNLFIDMTGTHFWALNAALNILCTSLADRGGEVLSVKIGGKTFPDLKTKTMKTSVARLNALLGSKFSSSDAKKLLERMGYGVGASGDELDIKIPCYRTDVFDEVDIFEDAAIAFDYNRFEPTLPNFFSIGEKKEDALARTVMVGLGFVEAVCWTLTNSKTNFEDMLAARHPCVEISNPLTKDFTMVRTWLLPSLLGVLRENRHEKMPQRLFEVGEAVLLEKQAVQVKKLCAVSTHANATFSDMKSVVEAVLHELGMRCEMRSGSHPSFITGRAATISRGARQIGIFGEIHPQVIRNFDLEQPVAAFEIEIE